MKLTVLLVCISAIASVANVGYAQSAKLTVVMENATVQSVLHEIENQSEFRFFFSGEVDVERTTSINMVESKVFDILDELFKDTEVAYRVYDRQIALIDESDIYENNPVASQMNAGDQQPAVSGTVTDASDQALPGVTVVVKGTTEGTVTDDDGEYSFTDLPDDATLVFSFVGMRTQEVEVGNQTSINVTMEEETIGIEEVVAVGYGTMRKSDLTGSVKRVNVEEMRELPNVSVMEAMQGTIAGLNVSAVNQPGQNPSVTVRGQNTLSSSSGANAPLIVVDGTIYRGSIVDLNTADIESVDILKDASSTAIYGSQASNGVMLVTTKKGGTSDKPIINYNGSYSVDVASNKIVPMQREEYDEFFPDVFWDNGSRLEPDYLEPNPDFSVANFLKTNHLARGYAEGIDTDWYGAFTGNGSKNSHNVSIQGRTDQLDYYVSGGITDVEGYVKNEDYARYSYRVNVDAEIVDWLNVGLESFLTSSDYSGVGPSIGTIFNLQPYAPAKDEDGEYIRQPEGSWLNPYLSIQQDDSDKRLNLFANIYTDIKLPVEGLSYKLNFSQNYRTRNNNRFNPLGGGFQGDGYKNSSLNYDWTADNIVTYVNTFNDVHNINATFVYGVEKRESSYTNNYAENFDNDLLGFNRLQAGDPSLFSINTGAGEEQSLYSMARVLYNFDNKYLITGTIRRDGFSGFGAEKKIGVFPSVAVAWSPSEEAFTQDMDWLGQLKFRGSYGSSGRRGVGRYDTKAVVNSTPYYVFGDGGSAQMGQWLSSLANNELGWETTTGINIGLDFNIFNSLLYGEIDYYNNTTKDVLYPIQLPQMTGFSSINTNIGEVANHGIEFTLSSQIINNQDFTWNATVNFSRNRNEIVSILGMDNDGDGKEDDLVANQLFIGEPTDVVYDYEIIGMWQLSDEEAGDIPDGFRAGQYKIADLNEDGDYSASDDRKILGYRDPSYRLGFSNTIDYKNFRLYAFINSIQGGKDYYYGNDNPYVDKYDQLTYMNVPSGAWDYWMPENPDARFRRLDLPSVYHPNRYLQRNFIRIQDVSLSYSFGQNLLSDYNIRNLRVFISGKNLATFTKWRGWDPETGVGFNAGRPVMKSYSIGVNVEF